MASCQRQRVRQINHFLEKQRNFVLSWSFPPLPAPQSKLPGADSAAHSPKERQKLVKGETGEGPPNAGQGAG